MESKPTLYVILSMRSMLVGVVIRAANGSNYEKKEDKKNTEPHSDVTQEFLSDPNDDYKWKVFAIVTSSLLGFVLIGTVLYFCWIRRIQLKKAIEEALAKWKPEPNPTPDSQQMFTQNQSFTTSLYGGGYHVVVPETGSPRDDEETKELNQ
ncbi:hypothetical protein FSP39_007906 [Pinctada imbricata]|uniref:Uncharacterized protein n=1 Tax=Pinctada imbricata TaxID=66713 RepID=A0AA88Y376_PINIB|nr:hypothetical protein FSP39_007906 [Pinctada imbricata]